jgi:anti-anti-sigma factor
MDSSGLRLLIEFYDRSRAEGWKLNLVCPEHEAAAVVIRVTGADKALPFEKAAES